MKVLKALVVAVMLFAGCAQAAPGQLVIEHVTVVPMAGAARTLSNATVIVKDGRVAAVRKARSGDRALPGRHLDGRGKWLIPGLTDAHTHLENPRLLQLYLGQKAEVPDDGVFLPYVANGVLQVVNLSAMSETLQQRRAIDAGEVLGPHIVAAAMVDGSPPLWPEGMTSIATTPEQGRQAVRDAKAQGYDMVKVYSKLQPNVFRAIVEEAAALRLPVVGHIPARNQGLTKEFFVPGFGMVAHAEEFAQQTVEPDHAAIPRYIDLLRANGTGMIATLTLDERIAQIMRQPESLRARAELAHLHPVLRTVVVEHNPYAARTKDAPYLERVVAFNRDLVRQAHRAGVPVLAGTDAPVPGVAPGFALHDELQALVAAGMSNYEALAAATRAPARWLGQQGQRGSIERGAHADLVLLEADPLADIANTRRIAAVIVQGAVHTRAELDKRMEALRKR